MATIALGTAGYFRYKAGKENLNEYIGATTAVFILDLITVLATTHLVA